MLYEMEQRLSHKIDGGLISVRGEMVSMQTGLRAEISAVHSELKSEISAVRSDLKSEISAVRSELKSEISALRSELISEIADLRVDFSGFKSELHRVALLVEEQNARNKFVLDGYAQLYELIERKLG